MVEEKHVGWGGGGGIPPSRIGLSRRKSIEIGNFQTLIKLRSLVVRT